MFGLNPLDKLLGLIGVYNQRFFPFSIILPVLLATSALVLTYYCFVRPGERSSKVMKIFLGILYGVAGLETFSAFLFGATDISYIVGAVIMWIFSTLFLLDIFWKETEFKLPHPKDLLIISLTLIVWGIFVYPLTEWLLGFTWPGMVFFGAECPSTIFTIGLLVGALPKVNKMLFALLSIGAIVSGGFFSFLGATFDIAYFASGVVGLLMLTKYRKIEVGYEGQSQ
ncbi:MAG: DUF6064 family protein [Candidatus Freyarchaeota archaeon]